MRMRVLSCGILCGLLQVAVSGWGQQDSAGGAEDDDAECG
jgi:hypothetical protein